MEGLPMTNESCVVLITAHIEAYWLERLQSLSPNLQIERWPTRSAGAMPDKLWQAVELLYTSFATPLPSPEQAPRLRWVQLYSAGPDHILDHPLFSTPVIFTTSSSAHAINMAEYVLTVGLAWFHRFPRILEWQQREQWPSRAPRARLVLAEALNVRPVAILGYGSTWRQVP